VRRCTRGGIGGRYEIGTQHEGWYTIGSINAPQYVSAQHVTNLAVSVDNEDAPCDFDVKQVRVTVTYKILE
jgi:hypothetical protein